MINIPEPSPENLTLIGTALAAVGAARAWFQKVMNKKLSVAAYEADKKLIAEQNKNHLNEVMKPIYDNQMELHLNLKSFFKHQGWDYIKIKKNDD